MSPSVSPLHRVPDFTHGSVLLSLWFEVVLIAATVAFVVVFAAVWVPPVRKRLRLIRRRRWPVALVSALLALVLATASVADAINRHFSYIPSFAALGGHYSPDLIGSSNVSELMRIADSGGGLPAHGVVVHVMLSGPRSGISRRGYVYLPRAYFNPAQRKRRFPVLYMLHGSPGVAADWLRGGFIDRAMDFLLGHGIIAPFIVVLPDVNGGYAHDTECQDIVQGPQVQTYLTDDVTGWVDHHFRTIAAPAGRAIGGMSSGGYCALNLLLRHQNVFSAAVMHSGSLAPIESNYSGSLWGGNDGLRRANTPRDYIATVPIHRPIAVYCDAGTSDPASAQTCVDAHNLLAARHVPVDVHVYPHQGHDYAAWRKDLYSSLPWVSRWFTAQGQTTRPRHQPYRLAAGHAHHSAKVRA
jgi:enterochelin esterase-like enzyme